MPHDFLVFTALWNRRQRLGTPRPHRLIARWLAAMWEAGERRLLLMAFRACGKSTLVALFAAWLLVRNPDLRIMVVAADMVLAEKMVRNIRRVIEKHPLCAALVPQHQESWAQMQFIVARRLVSRDPSVLARSVMTNVTGSRADIIICDDVEVPQTADTPVRRMDLREKLRELDYVLSPGGTMLFIGTPHSYDSIYAAAPAAGGVEAEAFLKDYARLELPLLDADGNSAWPERYPPDAIAALRAKSGERKFMSQMLLRPVSITDARLSPDLLRVYADALTYEEGNQQSRLMLGETQLLSASCWWDPAFSGAQDKSVVALVFTDADGHYYFHSILYATADPAATKSEVQQQCDQVADFMAQYFVPSIHIECNGVGAFLPSYLRETLRKRGMGAAVQREYASDSKVKRIVAAIETPLSAGKILVHQSVWQSDFVTEMREWNPARRDSADDALDALAGAIGAEPVRITSVSGRTQRPNWAAKPVIAEH